MKTKKWPFIYVGVITVITYIPILLTVVYSFNASRISSIWEGFSLKWYAELFHDRDIWEALRNSLILAVLSCLGAVVIGTMGALGMYRKKSRLNDAVAYLSMLPIMIPEIILGMVFLSVFSLMGLPFGMVTLVIAHTTFCIPYVYSTVKARLVGMDKSLEEAALDLGACGWRVFFDVTLPLIAPAIWSGAMLSFAMSFDDVVISIFLTGPTVNTLPVKIYTKLKTGVTPEINALATLMLGVTILLLAGAALVGRGKRKK
ncbi:MAG TPA: ABC transporter permease [Candidatus Acetatifactor stercoripullorum]|uniref:ABC transporter permease n=1 Tax=Candidatus Acetatifactor stercoripullorum TaxID=2838414 RepID=A0A9D1UD13_9FIRM|nr:ABC transporter permease [uncultured Acetatifactor sp.]HIW82111.1 ABC transporter permease [Candidatus Acetatifactor stercoripullorum]